MVVHTNLIHGQSTFLGSSTSEGVRLVAYMLAGVTSLLLQEVDQIRRTKFAEGDERLGAGIDGLL